MVLTEHLFYHDQFVDYLHHTNPYRSVDVQIVLDFVGYAEMALFPLLKNTCKGDFPTLYDYVNKEELANVLTEMLPGHRFGEINNDSGGKLRDCLQFYIGYLNSKYHPLSEKQKRNKRKTYKNETSTSEEQFDNQIKKSSGSINTPSSIQEPESYDKLEGKKHEDSVIRYERDRGNRKACIDHYGYVCQVCGMNFEIAYGELGKNFIEVHHLHPVAQGERQVNPIEDLIPLCSNCHSMIHRQDDVSDWKGLREKFLTYKSIRNEH